MPRPTFLIRSVPIQIPARICFKIRHHSFRSSIRIDNRMHVVASHVCSQQIPTAKTTDLLKRMQNHLPPVSIQNIQRMCHRPLFSGSQLGIGLKEPSSRLIMIAVHRSALIPVEMIAIAGKRNEISHRSPQPKPIPSRARQQASSPNIATQQNPSRASQYARGAEPLRLLKFWQFA